MVAVLTVRAAGVGDRPAVAALAAMRRREALTPGPGAELEAAAWAGLIAGAIGRPSTPLFVLAQGGALGGYAVAGVVDGLAGVPEGAIADLFVLPALRRRGGGRALALACETALRALGCPSLTAQVPAQGPGAAAAQALAGHLGLAAERVVLARPVRQAAGGSSPAPAQMAVLGSPVSATGSLAWRSR